MLTSEQIGDFKKRLESRKEEVTTQLEANDHFNIENAMVKESMGELSNYDNHPADHGTILYEREKDIALNEHSENELKNIDHALNKINQGQYGKCEECGKEIAFERLEAIPTTTFCIEHSKDQQISRSRPIEEEVLTPPFGRYEEDEQDRTFYDSEDSWQDVARYGTSNTPSDFSGQRDIEYYSQTFAESDEAVSYVEDIEAFAGNDIYGNGVEVYPNHLHDEYEQRLDEEGLMTIWGDLPYTETEGYVKEDE